MSKNKNRSKEYVRFYKTKEIPMKKSNQKAEETAKIGCGVVAALIFIIPLLLFITPLFLMWTWNLAVCALFPTLPAMTYWVAFGVNWFLNIIGNKFTGSVSSAINHLHSRD